MKKLLIASAGFILLQLSVSLVTADELLPILDPKGYRQTLPGMLPPAQIPAVGTLSGTVQAVDGRPLSGGKVYFFNEAMGPPPASEKYWRVPDETALLDNQGGFSVDLPPGKYYIGAIQRKADKTMIGFPADGDIYFDGKIPYEVQPATQTKIPVIRGGEPFSTQLIEGSETICAIEGTVTDGSGQPVMNALVFAYTTAEMKGRPLFVSAQTDKSGAYRLRVAGDGTYFLRVSAIYGGGMPGAGSVKGVYGGDTPKAVAVKKGEVIKNINLTGVEFVKTPGKPEDTKK